MFWRCGVTAACPLLFGSAIIALAGDATAGEVSVESALGEVDGDADRGGQPDDVSLRVGIGPAWLGAFTRQDGLSADAGDTGGAMMATGELLLDIPFSDHFGFELAGRFGMTPNASATSLVALGLGFRGGLDLGAGFLAHASARVFHIHDAPNRAWLDATGPTLAGDPEFGLAHITAAGGAVGLAWELPHTGRRLLLTFDIEVLGRLHGHGNRALPTTWVTAPVGLRWRI